MPWPKPQTGERERVDLAIVVEFLIGLEALQSIDRIISPFAIHLTLEIAAIGEGLLNLLVALRVRMSLITRARSCAPGRPSGNFVACCASFDE
jgi:hypothetical protein